MKAFSTAVVPPIRNVTQYVLETRLYNLTCFLRCRCCVRKDYPAMSALKTALLNERQRGIFSVMDSGVLGDMSSFETAIAIKDPLPFRYYVMKGGYVPPRSIKDYRYSSMFMNEETRELYNDIVDSI